ncbi:senescence-associated protein-like protein [Ostreococcus tauri]|nr:senescence-associated protein-like protein [Ostreococcus tauri]
MRRVTGLKSFLRTLLRLTNATLLAGGLATALFAFHLWLGFNRRRNGEEVGPDWADPSSGGGGVDDFDSSSMESAKRRVRMFFETEPWFLYFVGGSGAFCAATAWLGLAGAENGNVCCLGMYAHQVMLMVLLQSALSAYVVSGKAYASAPTDVTGEYANAWTFIREHEKAVTAIVLVVFFVQILSIILAVALRRAAIESGGADSDDEEDSYYFDRYGQERAPLVGSYERAASGDSAWRIRMREKYGLDTADFEYSPSRPPASRVDREKQRERDANACVIQ